MKPRAWISASWAALALCGLVAVSARAEPIKIGVLKTSGSGLVFIAQQKGYFVAEGVPAQIVFFDSAQPISVAAASGDIDFGVTGLSGGFYNLAAQGALCIVGGGAREESGFQYQSYLVSNRAYEEGLRSFKDFPGHSFGITQIGSPPHYSLALVAEKYGFDLKSMRIVPLQSISNALSATIGGQTDLTLLPGTSSMPSIQRGEVKLLGWVGNETPYQLVGVFAATKTANERGDTVRQFLRAFAKAARDYHDAFTDAEGKRRNEATAPEIVGILASFLGLTADQVNLGIAGVDVEARLDVKDVLHQIAWYKSQGMVKGDFDPNAIIDMRYVVPVPDK